MANTSAQEKIEQLRRNLEYQANPNKNALSYEEYQKLNQPLYWQWSIRWETPAEKRKARWTRAWDAAKWALSSIYGAATFIPETLWRIGTAWVDQIAGTDTQSKLDEIAGYVPNKLRNSASNSKMFDKWQEYTDDALMAAALLTAWATWPKSPKARLQDLSKNPLKYSSSEATNIVRNAIDAWVDWVKSWKVKLTPEQVASKASLNRIWEMKWLEASNYDWISDTWNRPAYQQKLFSEYTNSKNWTNMETFRDIPSWEIKKLWWEYWYYESPILWKWEYHPLWKPLTPEEIANMKQYLAKDISDYLWLESEYESLWDIPYETAKKLLKDYKEYRANIEKNNASKAKAADEEAFAIESLIQDDVYPIRVKDVQERLNTSRARANATKKRNMSARERAARERAEDSANELRAAWRWRWARKVQTTLDDIAFEDWFASLEDAERFARADWFKSYKDAKLAWRDYRALNEQLIARNELDATRARADAADQTLEEMFEEWKRLNRQ